MSHPVTNPSPPFPIHRQLDYDSDPLRLRGTYTNASITGYTSELDYLTATVNASAAAAARLRDQRTNTAYNNNYADYGCAEVQPLDDAGALPAVLMTATSNQRRHRPGEPLLLDVDADDAVDRPDGRHQHRQQQIDNISYSYCDNRAARPDAEQVAAAERAALELGEMAQAQAQRMAQQRRMEQHLVSARAGHFVRKLFGML